MVSLSCVEGRALPYEVVPGDVWVSRAGAQGLAR